MAGSELMRAIRAMATRCRRDAFEANATPAQRADARAHAERRRALLQRALALGAAAAMPAVVGASAIRAQSNARVVIVGGGLAGLAAAWELSQAGVRATIFEAAPRVGGRCWTERRAFDDDQIAERGGELIDTTHEAIIDLAATFALPLDDLIAAEPRGSESLWLFDQTPYTLAAATADMQACSRDSMPTRACSTPRCRPTVARPRRSAGSIARRPPTGSPRA